MKQRGLAAMKPYIKPILILIAFFALHLMLLEAQAQIAAPESGKDPLQIAAPETGKDPARPVHDKWALIIGLSRFQDPSLNLKYAAKDASDLAQYLVKSANFAPDHVKVLLNENASRGKILDTLGDKWLPRVAGPDDLVFIFISTHGSPAAMDLASVNYLIAYDTDKERMYSTGIAMQDLTRIIKSRVHCDRILIVLDACHSGAVAAEGQKGMLRSGNFDAADIAQGSGHLVISSSAANQVSWESKRYPNSVFTHALITSLSDTGGKNTGLSEAFSKVEELVSSEVRRDRGAQQTPVMKGKWSGEQLQIAALPTHPSEGLGKEDTLAEPIRESSQSAPESKSQTRTEHAAAQKALIALMPFGGPEKINSDAGLVFAIKSQGFARPRESELRDVPAALSQALCKELRSRYGDRIMDSKAVSDLRSSGGVAALRSGAMEEHADYLLDCLVHQVDFNGDELFGAKWAVEYSFFLRSLSSGKTIVSRKEHCQEGTIKSSQDPLKTIYTDAVDKIARSIADKIDSKLSKLLPAENITGTAPVSKSKD